MCSHPLYTTLQATIQRDVSASFCLTYTRDSENPAGNVIHDELCQWIRWFVISLTAEGWDSWKRASDVTHDSAVRQSKSSPDLRPCFIAQSWGGLLKKKTNCVTPWLLNLSPCYNMTWQLKINIYIWSSHTCYNMQIRSLMPDSIFWTEKSNPEQWPLCHSYVKWQPECRVNARCF